MARPFSSADAKYVINAHNEINATLSSAVQAADSYKEEVVKAIDDFIEEKVVAMLQEVPIDELNREKNGIRIKALKDKGYNTIGDIAHLTWGQLAYFNGISEDSAYTIRRIVDNMIDGTRDGVKLKLSADSKTPKADALVAAITRYQRGISVADRSKRILSEVSQGINNSIIELNAGTNGFSWFFSSSAKKQRMTAAYQYLSGMLQGQYGLDTQALGLEYQRLRQITPKDGWDAFVSNPVSFFNIIEDINPGVLGTDDIVYGLPEDLAQEIQDEQLFPDGLLCTLRRYQEWGVKYILHQEKVLLGDEMGLGKTVQAIAAMVSLKNTGATHFMVVCPASVLSNWCREISKMSRLNPIKIHGSGRADVLRGWLKHGGVAVTTYETTGFIRLPDDYRFSLLVVDEAHYIKNPEAKRTLNTARISSYAERLLFMTGTALENKVDEMISLVGLLQPQIAASLKGIAYMSHAPQFRSAVAPVYYRRKREEVLTELPELIESKEWCTLNPEEEEMYERTLYEHNFMAVRRVSWNIEDIRNSSKAKRMMELIEEAESDGRKVIVFSFFLDTIRAVTTLLGRKCLNPINGAVSPQRRQEIIDEFENAPAGTVLAAQIQSGGTGLNIQSASVVIICEPQFKPSIENQAISRAYRMGQTRNVLVYRLLADDTVDEEITQLLENKQAIFDAFADKSDAAEKSFEIDERTFGNIIEEEIKRINALKGGNTEQEGESYV